MIPNIEPTDYPQGWYHVYVNYADGHKPVVTDLAKLADILPHGSGIGGDWNIEVKRNGDITVHGEYHAMDDGGYCGWRNFRFSIRRATRNIYQALRGPCEGQYQVTRVKGRVYLDTFVGGGDASDYLYDCVPIALPDILGIRAIDSIVVPSEQAAQLVA